MEYSVKATDDGWKGSKHGTWCGENELKALLRNEFKKNGLKVSVRSRRSGWLTALDFTMKISPEDICSLEEYRGKFDGVWKVASFNQWLEYYDDNHEYHRISIDMFFELDGEKRKDIENRIWDASYQNGIRRIKEGYEVGGYIQNYLRPEALRKYRLMVGIVSSFNRDKSDVMTDYFDRAIYDDYYLKVA